MRLLVFALASLAFACSPNSDGFRFDDGGGGAPGAGGETSARGTETTAAGGAQAAVGGSSVPRAAGGARASTAAPSTGGTAPSVTATASVGGGASGGASAASTIDYCDLNHFRMISCQLRAGYPTPCSDSFCKTAVCVVTNVQAVGYCWPTCESGTPLAAEPAVCIDPNS